MYALEIIVAQNNIISESEKYARTRGWNVPAINPTLYSYYGPRTSAHRRFFRRVALAARSLSPTRALRLVLKNGGGA
jgi:hypothetical protein